MDFYDLSHQKIHSTHSFLSGEAPFYIIRNKLQLVLSQFETMILWKQSICRVRSLSLGKLGYTPCLAEENETFIVHFNVAI